MAQHTRSLLLLVVLMTISICTSANSFTISGIQVKGIAQRSVDSVRVAEGKAQAAVRQVEVGQQFPSSTRLETPPKVRLQVRTTNGTELEVDPATVFRLNVTNTNEDVNVTSGNVFAKVGRAVSSFGIGTAGKRYYGKSKGTAFGISVTNAGVKFNLTQGEAAITQQVPIKVGAGQQGGNDKKRRPSPSIAQTSTLTPANAQVSFDPTAQSAVEFTTYDQAIDYYVSAFEDALQRNDQVDAADILSSVGVLELDAGNLEDAVVTLASAIELNLDLIPSGLDYVFVDDRTNLGYAYMDLNMPAEALEQIQEAIQVLFEIDPDSPELAEALLDETEAYMALEDYENAGLALNDAVLILEADVEFGKYVLDEAIAQSEGFLTDLVVISAIEVGQQLDSLGWAYAAQGRDEESSIAYEQSNDLANQLAQAGIDAGY